MRKSIWRFAPLLATAGLASCGGGSEGGSSAPQGQVVAKIGGDEVTVRELSMELQGIQPSTPEASKAAERQALAVIISRKVLADKAREQGVDDSPEFQLARRRAEETLLAQGLQRQIAANIARPTREEAEQYVASHPHSFAQRKIFIVDQVQFPRNLKPEVLKALAPMTSLQDIEQYLLANGIEHRRVPGSLDTRGAPGRLVEQILRLPANGVFTLPNQNMLAANQITETRLVPFTGEQAIQQAQQILANERINQELKKRIEQFQKAAGKVQYKQGYGPPEPSPTQNRPVQRQQKQGTRRAETPPA